MSVLLPVVCVAAAVGAVIAVWRGSSRFAPTELRCRDGSIFHGPTVGADEARRLRDHLERVAFFREAQRFVELRREAGVYQFRIPGTRGVERDDELVARCAVIAAALAGEVFPGAAVEVHLCDSALRTLNVVPHRGRYGERLRFNAAEVFYTVGVTEGEAVGLGTYLMGHGFFNDKPKLAQLNRAGDGFELRLEVREGCASRPDLRKEFRRMAGDLSRDVLRGSPVEVVSSESVRETLRDQGDGPERKPTEGLGRVFIGPMSYDLPIGGPDSSPPDSPPSGV